MSLQTYAGSDLNRISSTLQKYLDGRKLKPGEMVKYRFLNGVINIDPQRRKGDDMLYPASIGFSLRDSIYDPGDEGEDNGRVVEIGAVKSFDDKTKTPRFRKFSYQPNKGDGGIYILRGGIVDDMEVYEAMELSNKNASNPFRDISQDILFERVNEVKESGVRTAKRNDLFDSLSAIRGWDYTQMRIMAAGYNINSTLPLEVLKDRLEAIAEGNPSAFAKSLDSEDLKVRALVKIAREAEVITFIPQENKWIFAASGEQLVILDRKEGVSEIEQFTDFLKNSANGKAVKAQMERMIATKKKKETA